MNTFGTILILLVVLGYIIYNNSDYKKCKDVREYREEQKRRGL